MKINWAVAGFAKCNRGKAATAGHHATGYKHVCDGGTVFVRILLGYFSSAKGPFLHVQSRNHVFSEMSLIPLTPSPRILQRSSWAAIIPGTVYLYELAYWVNWQQSMHNQGGMPSQLETVYGEKWSLTIRKQCLWYHTPRISTHWTNAAQCYIILLVNWNFA